jgi:hypothetical protein
MSNLVKFANAGLPAVQSLSTALRSISTEVEMGVVILKMDRTGTWVYGADQTEVEDDATWAVNPFSFVHGWIAWGDGEVLAEVVAPITQPIPEVDEAPAGAKKGWEKVVGMQLQCTNGADSGLDVRFTTTSVGGKRAVQTLAAEIAAQVDKDPTKPVPIVRLKKEHYQHKTYGKIYTPMFVVQSWMDMSGAAEPEVEDVADEEPAPAQEAPRRRRAV